MKFKKYNFASKIAAAFSLAAAVLLTGGAGAHAAKTPPVSDEVIQQRITIKGVVVDAQGLPVPGAGVIQKGTTNGVMTADDGSFSINVPAGAVLRVSCIGYADAEVAAASGIRVVLQEDHEFLDDAVVIGYGTQKKTNLTGAVASVDVEKALGSRPLADIGRGLQGSVPGMNITVPTGEVGSDPLIKIRGQIGSISGSNSPLILLDNVEIPSIQIVNPQDVQSISILKDAASSSIYGAKAAFGVILITTKTGARATDKLEVSYSNNFSWQDPAKDIEIGGIEALQYTLDAQINRSEPMPAGGFWRINPESLQKAKEWQQTYGGKVKYNDPVVYGRDWYYDGLNKYGYRLYDIAKAMISNWTPTSSHNLSVSGKSGRTNYNIGLGYLDQTGMAKTARKDDFQRYNASLNVTSEINDHLAVRAGFIYSDRNKRYPGIGNTTADPWLYMYRWSPLFPSGVTELGSPLKEPAYEMAAANTDNLQTKYFNVNLGFTVNFTKDWDLNFDYTYARQTAETNASVTQYTAGNHWYAPVPWTEDGHQVFVDEQGNVVDTGGMPAYRFPIETYTNSSGPTATQVSYQNRTSDANTINVYTTYNLLLGKEKYHAFKFMAGLNRVASQWDLHKGWKTNLLDLTNPQLPLASGDQFFEGDRDWEAQLGFFGRLNYSFDDRLFFEANIRRDGSSKFPKELQWRWFPSFSAGWVFTNEKFMKPLDRVLSFGKIRASWGSIGDQTVSNNLYKSVLSGGQSSWLDGTTKLPTYGTPSLVDNDISWQEIETLDIGADIRFFKNKLGFTFDWYRRDTKNMIIAGESLPATLGTGAPSGNYGSLRTNGWELAADFNHRFANGWGINVMATLSDATTTITRGADYLTPWEDRLLSNSYSTGRRYGDIYGLVTDRLFQKDDFVYGPDGQIEKMVVVYNGTAHTTNRQTSEYPVYQVHYEDGNKLIFSPGDVKFVDIDGDGYITPGTSTNGNPGDLTVIGNSTPRYEYSLRIGTDYKGFDFSIFLQGIGKRKIWGSGQLAIPGYNAKEGALPKTFTTDYWTEERTDAFYPRAWDLGGSDTGFSMQTQSRYLLNMAYLRVKNITLGYSVPEKLLSKIRVSTLRVYMSLENFFTFDKLRGLPIDPEAISGYSMFTSNYNLGRTGTGTPIFKTMSCGVQLTF